MSETGSKACRLAEVTSDQEPDPESSPPGSWCGIAPQEVHSGASSEPVMEHTSESSRIGRVARLNEEHDSSDLKMVEVAPEEIRGGVIQDRDAESEECFCENISSPHSSDSSTTSLSSQVSSISDSLFVERSLLFPDVSDSVYPLQLAWPMTTIVEQERCLSPQTVSSVSTPRSFTLAVSSTLSIPLDVDEATTRVQTVIHGHKPECKCLSNYRAAVKLQSWFRKCLRERILDEIPSEGRLNIVPSVTYKGESTVLKCHHRSPEIGESTFVSLDVENTLVSLDDEDLNKFFVVSLDDDLKELLDTHPASGTHPALHREALSAPCPPSVASQGVRRRPFATSWLAPLTCVDSCTSDSVWCDDGILDEVESRHVVNTFSAFEWPKVKAGTNLVADVRIHEGTRISNVQTLLADEHTS